MGINGLGLVTTFSRSGALVLFIVGMIVIFSYFSLLKPKLIGILIGAAGICVIETG